MQASRTESPTAIFNSRAADEERIEISRKPALPTMTNGELCGSLAVVSHQLLDFVLLDSQTKGFRYQEMLELFPSEIRHAISKMVNMYDSAGDGAVRQKFTFGSPNRTGS